MVRRCLAYPFTVVQFEMHPAMGHGLLVLRSIPGRTLKGASHLVGSVGCRWPITAASGPGSRCAARPEWADGSEWAAGSGVPPTAGVST